MELSPNTIWRGLPAAMNFGTFGGDAVLPLASLLAPPNASRATTLRAGDDAGLAE
jgi:hypothetical protein